MVHWCLGMYASGSTWAYNVTAKIAASFDPMRGVVVHFVSCAEDVEKFARILAARPGHSHVVKTHDVQGEDAIAALASRADAIIVTIRDPRDAVTSLMLYMNRPFDTALSIVEGSARPCARFAGDKRSLLLRYEAGFFDDVTTLDRIAEGFHRSLTSVDQTQIFASSRRAAIEAFIAKMPQRPTTRPNPARPGHSFDGVTHWHTHHAGRTGEIGRWRRLLTGGQVSEVERRLGDWMDHFSYRRYHVQPDA